MSTTPRCFYGRVAMRDGSLTWHTGSWLFTCPTCRTTYRPVFWQANHMRALDQAILHTRACNGRPHPWQLITALGAINL